MTSSSILIVEADTSFAEWLQLSLKNLGYVVSGVVGSFEEALHFVEEDCPDLVLVNVILNGSIDGIETARQIISLFHLPVVYLMSYADDETMNRAKLTEPSGFLVIPVHERELRTTIEMALYKHHAEKELARSEAKFQKIFNQSNDAICVIDPVQDEILEVNPKSCMMLGYTEKELLKKAVSEIYTDQAPELNAFVQVVLQKGEGWTDQLTCRNKVGQMIPLEVSASVIHLRGKTCILQLKRDISERKAAETMLRDSEEQFRVIFEQSSDSILLVDPVDGGIVAFNVNAHESLGYSREDFSRLSIYDIEADEPSAKMRKCLQQVVSENGDSWKTTHCTKDGQVRDVRISARPISIRGKEFLLSVLHDVTEKTQAERFYRITSAILNNATEGIMVSDPNGNILTINQAFTKITGYSSDEVVGKNARILQSGRHTKGFYEEMWQAMTGVGHWRGEVWNRRKNGEVYPEWLSITSVKGSEEETVQYIGLFSDITKLKQDEEKLYFQAHYDPLTKLPNRMLILERLSQAVKRARREKKRAALFFVDLDRFKHVNDSFGHVAGDEILKKAAHRLLSCVRETDTIGRSGGDEFIVVLPDIEGRKEASFVAKKIIEKLSHPFQLEGQEIFLGASVGIAIVPDDSEEEDLLLKNADMAMYKAKASGRSTFCFFSDKMEEIAKARTRLEADLRRALDKGEMTLYYQPIVDLHTLKTSSLEALVRWNHPGRGLLLPGEFIPLAEESGLINQIGEWVLVTATRQVGRWQDQFGFQGAISVNMSSRQFMYEDFCSTIIQALDQSGLSPEYLTLEITESLMLDSVEEVLKKLQTLKEIGVRLAIDDFGTGYSSLSYLNKYPIDFLKIDQSFITNIASNPKKRPLVEAALRMGQSMQMEVIAEGVETQEVLSYLRLLRCDAAQGHYFSQPLSENAYEAVLINQKKDTFQ
ncbi:MAG: EAL domain-containing protein [Nitrospiria bacterium]